MARFFVVMGVSGCGKTTVGLALAAHLDCPFYDADDFHSAENVAKMGRGEPLNDQDRAPWLATLAALIEKQLSNGETAVLACSALKKRYRDQLSVSRDVQFIFLDGSFDLIWQRMQSRENHFMRAEMLHSQFDTIEMPGADEAITVSINQDVDGIMAQILLEI